MDPRDEILDAASRWASALELVANCPGDRPSDGAVDAITAAESELLAAVLRWQRGRVGAPGRAARRA